MDKVLTEIISSVTGAVILLTISTIISAVLMLKTHKREKKKLILMLPQ